MTFKATALPMAVRRRILFFGLCLLWLGLAAVPMALLLGGSGWTMAGVITFVIYIVLMAQVSFGFTLALVGYIVLRRGGDPESITRTVPSDESIGELPATAIIMPIFNEDVARVFQALRVMFHSLKATGRSDAFDFFILSDSNNPNHWLAEEMAWLDLCRQTKGFGSIFYRNRRVALHHKSGNVADFCRRWGAKYRYAIVLDADSIMKGDTLVRLVAMMEKNQSVGIIQTNPQIVLGQSWFQRIMQFAGRVYGPIFMAGASFWQNGSSGYWGHNAIIRLRPFIKHCAMPELPKTEALGTRILSHDTIEAALMRAAGFGVWFAYDLEGSYEESPPDLIASLKRDRRWCRGNLQHLWFLFARGLELPSRWHILNGIMAYASSLLWMIMLLLGTLSVAATPGDISEKTKITGVILFGFVMLLLFVPKGLGVALLFHSPEKVKKFGGRKAVILSALAETIFSFLLAPILMLFHSRFVLASFLASFGRSVNWGGQKRENDVPSWRECIATHGVNTIFVIVWVAFVFSMAPRHLLWLWPVFLGPLIAIPFTRFTAKAAETNAKRAKKWFQVPEEVAPPHELAELSSGLTLGADEFFRAKKYAADFGLLQALLDPYINALHVSFLRQRNPSSTHIRKHMNTLGEKLLRSGPTALSPREKYALLWDANLVRELHRRLWRSPGDEIHEWWQSAFRHYNESLPPTV